MTDDEMLEQARALWPALEWETDSQCVSSRVHPLEVWITPPIIRQRGGVMLSVYLRAYDHIDTICIVTQHCNDVSEAITAAKAALRAYITPLATALGE